MATIRLNNMPCIVADDVLVFDPNGGVGTYANTLSGSFTYPSGDKPCSILINKGVDLSSSACHGWLGFPETVIFRNRDGSFGIGKFKSTSEIPNRADVKWAVGGMGLLDKYNPAEEGFSRFTKDGKSYNYSDVVRLTSHTLIGIKDNKCYLVYVPSMTGSQVNAYAKKCGFEKAIMLDGGHISAINGSESYAKINLYTKQGFALQGIDFKLTEKKKYKVVLDAGHNVLNQSNQSADGSYKEFEHNIDIVSKIIPHLERNGIEAIFIDVENASQSTELTKLVKLIDASKSDVLVSIHTDANKNTVANGQTIYSYKLTGESQRLAEAIHSETVPFLGTTDRGIRDGSDLYVIKVPLLPCVLIESGFHTNLEDLAKLKSQAFREKEALCIAKGIVKYFKQTWVNEPIEVKTFLVQIDSLTKSGAEVLWSELQENGYNAIIKEN